jgi:hypothetical protein
MSRLSPGKKAEKEEPTAAKLKVAVAAQPVDASARNPATALIAPSSSPNRLMKLGFCIGVVNLPALQMQLGRAGHFSDGKSRGFPKFRRGCKA